MPESNRSRDIVLLQSVGLARIVASWREIRQAKKVLVFDPYTLEDRRPEGRVNRLTWWLLRRLAGGQVSRVDRATRNRLGQLNLYASDVYVEAAMQRVRCMKSYQVLYKIVANDAVDRMYSRLLLPYIHAATQFYRFAEYLLKEEGAITLIPEDDDPWQTRRHFELKGAQFPRSIRMLNPWSVWRRRITALFMNGAVWPAVLIRHIFRSFHPGVPDQPVVNVPVVVPLVWKLSDKKRLQWDNESFFGGELNSHTVAFYYSSWRLTAEERAEQERLMSQRGIRWFDAVTLRADKSHRSEIYRLAASLAKALIQNPVALLMEPPAVVLASGFILSALLKELLFNRRVQYSVRVECADYEPNSVMRTIVANHFGRATVGVHHSANSLTHVFPEIRYLFMNRLCVWNERFRKAFGHHWDAVECMPIGNHRLDYVVQALKPESLGSLRTQIRSRWGIHGAVVLVTLPTHPADVEYQIPDRFPELYRGILQALEAIPELWVVLRPRSRKSLERYRGEPSLRSLMTHPRVIWDSVELSTYEWIAVADVVVGNSASSVVIEAGAAGKKCFSFDTEGLGEVTFGDYGADFVITKADQFVRAMKGALYGHPILDCEWERFAHEQTYFADGQNIQRFREAIWGLVVRVQRGDSYPDQPRKQQIPLEIETREVAVPIINEKVWHGM